MHKYVHRPKLNQKEKQIRKQTSHKDNIKRVTDTKTQFVYACMYNHDARHGPCNREASTMRLRMMCPTRHTLFCNILLYNYVYKLIIFAHSPILVRENSEALGATIRRLTPDPASDAAAMPAATEPCPKLAKLRADAATEDAATETTEP